ncbi:DUF2209 domain-containing protein [Thermococci archaeon]|nr:MAG: DUF2209 domain-containing protein [Thermococci archaeon]RLF97116.1 MAG: DUF2209 domain-containing protein [Thermococci archaeon]
MARVVGFDISGKHSVNGKYYLVFAFVEAEISPTRVERVLDVKLDLEITETPLTHSDLARVILRNLPIEFDYITSERGEFKGKEEWIVKGILGGREFKFCETLGEIELVRIAHHVSKASRDLLMRVFHEGSGSLQRKV